LKDTVAETKLTSASQPPRQLVATPRQILLGLKKLQPGRKPLFMCSGLVVGHRFSPLVGAALVPVVDLDIVWLGRTFPGFEKRL
jgi:hypothetical protein